MNSTAQLPGSGLQAKLSSRSLAIIATFALLVSVSYAAYIWMRGPLLTIADVPARARLVAHAGGAINGKSYTNSLEAMEHSYEVGFRYFEVDFNWTSDGELACVHDWDSSFVQFFPNAPVQVPSLEEFERLEMVDGLTQLTLATVMRWLATKGDAFLITDIKESNIAALRLIHERYTEQTHQVIPQVYTPDEIAPTRSIGFQDIILTVYRCPLSRREILKRLETEKLFAVTLPVERLKRWGYARNLSRRFFVYAHTVNTQEDVIGASAEGVDGFYTDLLLPSSTPSLQ